MKAYRFCFAISLLIIPCNEWNWMIRAAIYDLFYRLFGSRRIFWSIDHKILFLKIIYYSIFYLFAKIRNFINLNFFLIILIQVLTNIFISILFFFISFYLKYLYLIISQIYLELKTFFKINNFFNVLFHDFIIYFIICISTNSLQYYSYYQHRCATF